MGKFVMQASIWIEKSDATDEVVGHISHLLINKGRINKLKYDVMTRFMRVIEEIAWVNDCTMTLFSTRVMGMEDFHKYGYHYASKTVTETLLDFSYDINSKDE